MSVSKYIFKEAWEERQLQVELHAKTHAHTEPNVYELICKGNKNQQGEINSLTPSI